MDARHLTWSEAIAWTHQSPAGFSRRHRAEEHFSTSIGVGDHVARVVLERCRAAAGRHGISSPWIVDVGAGDGLLLRQLLKLGFPAEQLVGVDVRRAPVDLPVRWIQGVAPACVPRFAGLLFAHEFLDDVPAEYVVDGRLQRADLTLGELAAPDDLQWLHKWTGGETGLVGRSRDEAWAHLVGSVEVGEAIAVDFRPGAPVGHRAGRRLSPVPDGSTDICAGVELRSCRDRTGGRVIPQHRVLAGRPAADVQEGAELAALRDRSGFGAFDWLITEVSSVGSPA